MTSRDRRTKAQLAEALASLEARIDDLEAEIAELEAELDDRGGPIRRQLAAGLRQLALDAPFDPALAAIAGNLADLLDDGLNPLAHAAYAKQLVEVLNRLTPVADPDANGQPNPLAEVFRLTAAK